MSAATAPRPQRTPSRTRGPLTEGATARAWSAPAREPRSPRDPGATGSTGSTARTGRTQRPERPGRTERSEETSRPELRVVRGLAPARSTLPFILLVTLILAGALVASMLLNARMAQTAYQMKSAQIELNVLNDHIDTVRSSVQEASSSEALAARAAALGMVPASAPGVVDLTSSTVSAGSAATGK